MKTTLLPEISVVLPVFNGQEYLHECIQSVLKQNLVNFELLIGDDCSTDVSRHIIHSFSDERIRYFYREKNLGVSKNINQLITVARAPLIRFLCQDDVLEKDCLDTEVRFFKEHPDIGMSFCKSIWIDRYGKEITRSALGDMPEVINPMLTMQLFLYYGCIPGSGSAVCVRKRSFDEFGKFNESFKVAQDFEMWIRICQQKNLGVIQKNLVYLRSHPKQQSRDYTFGVVYISESRKIVAKILLLLPEEIHSYAKRYVRFRQDVQHTHYCLRCLISGRFKDFIRIVRLMGKYDFIFGILCWLLTLNNRFYHPQPRFVR